MENAREAIEEFEKEYQQDMKDIRRQEKEEGTFRKGELLGRFTAKKLFGWTYWGLEEQLSTPRTLESFAVTHLFSLNIL